MHFTLDVPSQSFKKIGFAIGSEAKTGNLTMAFMKFKLASMCKVKYPLLHSKRFTYLISGIIKCENDQNGSKLKIAICSGPVNALWCWMQLGSPTKICCQFTLKQTGIYSAATFFGFRTGRRYGGERSWRGELGFCFTACTSQAHVMPWVRTFLCKNKHLYSSIKWWLPCPLGRGWCSETRDPQQENVADRPSNLLAKAWKLKESM